MTLSELLKLAGEATKGPWSVRQGEVPDDTWVASDAEPPWEPHMALKLLWVRFWAGGTYEGKPYQQQSHRNASYIAACSPERIAALVRVAEISKLAVGSPDKTPYYPPRRELSSGGVMNDLAEALSQLDEVLL